MRLARALAVVGVFVVAVPVLAQDQAEDATAAPIHLGPLGIAPTIAVTNVGLESNVFNEAVDPKQDMTATIGPSVRLSMDAGPARLSGVSSAQYVYFNRYSNQRTLGASQQLRLDVPLVHLTPFIAGLIASQKQRPSIDVDTRVRQKTTSVSLGVNVRFSTRTNVILSGTRTRTAFGDSETYLGTSLATALNQATNAEQLQLRYALTPLTTLVVTADALQDRFPRDPLRQSNSIRIMPGFELKPSALISGTVFVGFRRFTPLDPAVPRYRGAVALVAAGYTVRATQFSVQVARDLQYSFLATQPYGISNSLGLTITQRVSHAWDVVAKGAQQRLTYQQLLTASSDRSGGPPRDTVGQLGAGIGYHVGNGMRLGVDVNYFRRRSTSQTVSDYKGLQIGASVTYGLSQ